METVRLTGLDRQVCRLGFGTEPLGGHAWGNVDATEVARAVHEALDRRVDYFDTADCYGRGLSEERLGRALGRHRKKAVIGSKFGVRFGNDGRVFYDNSPAWIVTALEGSLRRLGTDWVDLYQLHWPDGRTPISAVFEQLDRLREAGKIRAYGVTNLDLVAAGITGAQAGLSSFSFEFSLANRSRQTAIQHGIDALGLTFLAWGALGQGILSGKYDAATRPAGNDRRANPRYANFHGETLDRNMAIIAAMRRIATMTGNRLLPQIALRWILDTLPGSLVLTGIKSRAQLVDNLAALAFRLPPAALAELDAVSAPHPGGRTHR